MNINKLLPKRGFASDNNAGVHPLIMKALNDVNIGHTIAYGDDPYTEKAIQSLQNIFGPRSSAFLVFNGTAANVLGLSALTQPYHSIICAETAHINVDECGAPEKFTGCKLTSIQTTNGKLTAGEVKKQLHGFGFEHHSQPGIISVSQTTEMGTVYTPSEIKELADLAHNHNMKLHMDGARISNAAVSLNMNFHEFTTDTGLDILSFGGTKNGMMYGEAVIFFDSALATDFKYRRKQGMQLASKMRYIAAQFNAFLENDLWKSNASHANKMAWLLYEKIKNIKEITVTQEVQANGIFVILPEKIVSELQKEYFFYPWDESRSEYRWMTSFDTTEEDIVGFTGKLKELLR
jgi:threonine aldolase